MRKIIIFVAILSCLGMIFPEAAEEITEYFIAPYGDRTADGSIENPFDTLHTAIEKIKPNGNPVVINMRKGIYYMEKPAVFGKSISGTAAAPVTVRAYNGEEVIISGGRPVVRWQETENGLWRAHIPEYKFIRNLEVNGTGAIRAQSDYKIFHEGKFGIRYFKDGIIIDKTGVPEGFKGKNCELLFQSGWYEYRIKIDRCEEDETNPQKLKMYFKLPYNHISFWTRENMMTENTGFTIINDMYLLDREGEFYFDNDSKFLYYKPRKGENINTSKAYIAKKDVLIKVQGENSENKAGNLVFEGLNFANTAWTKAEYEGFINTQSVMYAEMANNIDTAYPAYGTIPAAVQVDKAENVVFKNNVFSNLGAVGLGIYDGVSGLVAEGNIFRDTGSSAVTVGMSVHMNEFYPVEEGKTNVAYRKPAWASNTYPAHNALYATNGSATDLWSSNNTYGRAVLTVDLLDEYKISKIALKPRGDVQYDNPGARKNFEIQASNDRSFKEYTVLGAQGESDFGINNTWSCDVDTKEKFRYVRFYKTDNGTGEISEFFVLTDESDGMQAKEVCKNNTIKNNVIARAGSDFVGSAGIHVFYTENLDISNNLLIDLPYTGISLGWGWTGTNSTCRNNKICNNRIEHIMQRQYDGGGIYLLGDQPNLLVQGNVIRDVRYGAGGIYPDEGTSGGSYQQRIIIKENVIEDTAYWLHNWSGTSAHIMTNGNYATSPNYVNSGSDAHVLTNYIYIKGNHPDEVEKIITESGPEGEYEELIKKVRGLPEYEAETEADYLSYGPHTAKEVDTAYLAGYYLTGLIMTAKWYDKIINENEITKNKEYNEFSAALEEAVAKYKRAVAGEGGTENVVKARVNLKNATDTLLATGILNSANGTKKYITSALINELAP